MHISFPLISNYLSFIPPFIFPLNTLHLSWLLLSPLVHTSHLQTNTSCVSHKNHCTILVSTWLLCLFTLHSSMFKKTQLSCFPLSYPPKAGEKKTWVEKIAMSATKQMEKRGQDKGMRGSQTNGWEKDREEKMSNQKWNNHHKPQHPHIQYTHAHKLTLSAWWNWEEVCWCCF